LAIESASCRVIGADHASAAPKRTDKKHFPITVKDTKTDTDKSYEKIISRNLMYYKKNETYSTIAPLEGSKQKADFLSSRL
jgi:hypothetical protein